MADENHTDFPRSSTTSANDFKRESGTYDPEQEIPDPEQVERDIQEQEDNHRGGDKRNPAA